MNPEASGEVSRARDNDIFKRSWKELAYHAQLLDLMKIDVSTKIQVHVGGVYGDKVRSMKRFVRRFFLLENQIRRRLVIENDDRLFNLQDCIRIGSETKLPVLFDVFHHRINGKGETVKKAVCLSRKTWNEKKDGAPMVDYSFKRICGSGRQHAESIDICRFEDSLKESSPVDFDVMLEIKDKEKSALRAVKAASHDPRFLKAMENK